MSDYAVMWASTQNLGDDIQTLAAINFFNKKGINSFSYIDREKLNEYDGKPVKLVMNGWFMHNINQFPPSKNIFPLFISFHCVKSKLIKENISYLKKYEPIGCRDYGTIKLLEKNDIKAYFTGCLTLFFDEIKEKNNCKYIVDVNTNLEEYKDFKKIKHHLNKKEIYNLPLRLELAKKLLNKYSKAESVVTTRLHCILPCRAFNTNVKFIHAKYKKDKNYWNSRFSGLEKYINGDRVEINNLKKTFKKYKI